MKAWLLDELKGLPALRLGEAPDPRPGPGEVVLDLDYAALNPADRYLAEGAYPANPPLPHILGRDGVGVASATGDGAGADGFSPGQRVLILRGATGVSRRGTFAQRVAVGTGSLVALPEGWTIQEAAGAPLVYLTAYQALTQWGQLPPSVVLVTGASGGVGVASIQLAKALGHTAVALSRNAAKRATLQQIGADYAVDPADPAWPASLKKLLAPRRVDLAIDSIGGALLPQVIETLGDRGKISLVGRLAGPVPEFNTASMFFRRLQMGGVAVGTYSVSECRAAWDAIVALLRQVSAKPLVDHIFPFEQLPAAFDRLAHGPMGKVLLDISTAAGSS